MGWLQDSQKLVSPPPITYIKYLLRTHKEKFHISLVGLKLFYHKTLQ